MDERTEDINVDQAKGAAAQHQSPKRRREIDWATGDCENASRRRAKADGETGETGDEVEDTVPTVDRNRDADEPDLFMGTE